MRVIEPVSNRERPNSRRRSKNYIKFFLLMILLLTIALFFVLKPKKANSPVVVPSTTQNQTSGSIVYDSIDNSGFIVFSGNEFRLLFDNINLPNLTPVPLPPFITGNDIADTKIRQIAETRGYKLRSSPIEQLSNVDSMPLQKAVHQPWLDLKSASNKAGLNMTMVSGYRSVENQRNLFVMRLADEGVTTEKIINGQADVLIDKVLRTTAPPGYSKHHTGYTIDLLCEGFIFENFKNSPCNSWLVENNFYQAKKYGFIPSYPLDADLQGPDYEAWEYVFVGANVLKAK